MNTPTREQLKLEAYRTALATRNFEIGLFWQRSNYFLALNTAIAVGFFSQNDARLRIPLGILGVIASVLWFAVTLGGKFWQSRWEHRTRVTEVELDPNMTLFAAPWEAVKADVEASFAFRGGGRFHRAVTRLVMLKPSVSFMMTLLSVAFVLFWIAVLVLSFVPIHSPSVG